MQAKRVSGSRSAVAESQRGRLLLAMIQAVAQDGYLKVTVTQVTTIAGISSKTYYQLFRSKDECFLATCEAIAAIGASRVANAFDSAEGVWRDRARAGFSAFFSELTSEADAANLVLVGALSAGPAGAEQRLKAMAPFERILRRGLEESPQTTSIDAITMHAIVAGTLQLVYRQFRRGTPESLHTLTDPVLDWALSYQAAAAIAPLPPPAPAPPVADSRVADALRNQMYVPVIHDPRKRIERAIIELVDEYGYGKLSMPAIAERARSSHETFYKHFTNKEEAFLAIFDEIAAGAEQATAEAVRAAQTWPQAVHDGLHALLTYLDKRSEFGPLPLRGIYTGPPAALDRADALLDVFRDLFTPRDEHVPDPAPTLPIADAIIGGIWDLIQNHAAAQPDVPLRTLTPQLTYLALAPFVGATEAVAAATGDA